MNPQDPYAPNPQSDPTLYGPPVNPYSPQQPLPPTPSQPKRNKKRLLIIGGSAAGLLLLLLIIALVAAGGSKKPAPNTQTPAQSGPQGPQPATAIGLEQLNNSISQDLSSIEDNRDFPANQLDDKALGL